MNKQQLQKRYEIIETHLRRYKTYLIAIKNLQETIDDISPNVTSSYEQRESTSSVFEIKSSTEDIAIDRIESRRVLNMLEEMRDYQRIINSIDNAMTALESQQRDLCNFRYIHNQSVQKTCQSANMSERVYHRERHKALKSLSISLSNIIKVV